MATSATCPSAHNSGEYGIKNDRPVIKGQWRQAKLNKIMQFVGMQGACAVKAITSTHLQAPTSVHQQARGRRSH